MMPDLMSDNSIVAKYHVIEKKVPTLYFIGVTTAQSSIMKVFPFWAEELARPDVVLEGVDLRPHDEAHAYRQAVAQIKYDPLSLGALVTTHKIDLLDASRDMFDYLDSYAEICGEVSSISKRGGALEGHAKDPITSGLSLDAVLGDDYFARTGGQVLCFGAGGSAVAIALHLINKRKAGDRPQRFVAVNRSTPSLDRLQKMVEVLNTDITFEYVHNQDPVLNDSIMEAMPEGSIVINATGMGKDRPGSPVTDAGRFPINGVAWELNYRGELNFMHQALAQRETRNVTVEDGWLYFLYGWTHVIAQVLHIDIDDDTFGRLAGLAETIRPR
jgi:shikimate 5-dehydrogenase